MSDTGKLYFLSSVFLHHSKGVSFCLKKESVSVNLNAVGTTGIYFIFVKQRFRLYTLFSQCGWISDFYRHFHPDLLVPGHLQRQSRKQPSRKRYILLSSRKRIYLILQA